ncbi:hypothetical protein MRX96_024071 [Rhipicephalus microplus]
MRRDRKTVSLQGSPLPSTIPCPRTPSRGARTSGSLSASKSTERESCSRTPYAFGGSHTTRRGYTDFPPWLRGSVFRKSPDNQGVRCSSRVRKPSDHFQHAHYRK